MTVRSRTEGGDAISSREEGKGAASCRSSDLNRMVEMLHGVHRSPSISAVIIGAIDGHDQLT